MDGVSAPLSKEEHNRIFLVIEKNVLKGIETPQKGEPLTAYFLAGQPGSGKGELARAAKRESAPTRTIIIDVDILREFHPLYAKWRADPKTEKDAANLSHEDASGWGKQLLRTAINNKCNIIVDGTLGRAESTQKQFDALSEAGYKIVVKSLAVQRELSQLGVYVRYEEGKATNEARWVGQEIQENAFIGLPNTLQVIEQNRTKYDAQVQVFNRKGEKLYDNQAIRLGGPQSAREALEAERNRPLSPEEKKIYSEKWGNVIESMNRRNAAPEEIQAAAKHTHLLRTAEARSDEQESTKAVKAVKSWSQRKSIGAPITVRELENARKLVGAKEGKVFPPKSMGEYIGKTLYMTETHLMQQVGKATVVAHELSKLENGAEMGTLYDAGKLTNRLLRIEYGTEKGKSEIVSHNAQRAAELKQKFNAWATKNIADLRLREPFMREVEAFMARTNNQAVKPTKIPEQQKTPTLDKAR